MTRHRTARTALATATVLAGLATLGSAQQQVGRAILDDRNDTWVEVTSVFGNIPTHGYAPVRVTLKNGSTTDRTWTVTFRTRSDSRYNNDADTFSTTFRLSAEKNSQAVHDVLVPVATLFDTRYSYGGPSLNVEVAGGGYGAQNFYQDSQTADEFPNIAVAAGIATRNLTALNDEVDKRGSSRSSNTQFGSSFDPKMLPKDWRGYTGIDVLIITDDEWLDLDPGVRTAVGDWLHLGGLLHVLSNKPNLDLEDLGFQVPADAKKASFALGGAELLQWEGKDVNVGRTVTRYENVAKNDRHRKRHHLAESFTRSWGLQDALGSRSFASWQVAVILIIFGILVGPVNLFVFAKAGQRHRLFFTTPIISVATSILLIMLIFFQDGTGGDGRRFAFVTIGDGTNRAYQIQEQVSRTGVLFGNSFDTAAPVFVSPVPMSYSRWATLSNGTNRSADFAYTLIEDSTFTGDWFRSRSEQSQHLETVKPTRARIERLPADQESGTPVLVSGIDATLEALYYVDDQGGMWKSTGAVPTGQKAVLEAIELAAYNSEVDDLTDLATDVLGERIQDLRGEHGTFFAKVSSSKHMVPTLDTIDWTADTTVFHGRVTTAP